MHDCPEASALIMLLHSFTQALPLVFHLSAHPKVKKNQIIKNDVGSVGHQLHHAPSISKSNILPV